MKFIGPPQQKKLLVRLLRFFTIFTGIILMGAAGTVFCLPLLGHWLVREDPVEEADAIAVLTGSLPTRAMEAADLYRRGYAKEIWLTHPAGRSSSVAGQSVPYPSENEFNVQVLLHEGVPAEAIHVFEMPIVNTADELDVIGTALKDRGDESVIVVTSKSHTRRVYALWSKYHAAEGKVIVHAMRDDRFEPASWWKRPGDTTQVIHEVLGMMNVWAGLPVQPMPGARGMVAASLTQATVKVAPVVVAQTRSKNLD
jgi:uncharacterized SAM-binding protein YcdF (DUF218 family)